MDVKDFSHPMAGLFSVRYCKGMMVVQFGFINAIEISVVNAEFVASPFWGATFIMS